MSLFGATSQSQSNSQQPKPFSFGTSSTGAAPSNLFGLSKPPEQKPFSFGPTQQPGGSIFGNPNQQSITQQPGASIFGGSAFGKSTQQQQQQPQRPADQTLRFGISTSEQQQNHAQSMWEEGRGLGVYRSIPAQMNIIKDKWDAATLSSPLRTYIYQHVGDETRPRG
jgi:nuclear pore complex protein Nup54